jgi:hypothetical protein
MYQHVLAAHVSTLAAQASTQSQAGPGLAAVAFVVCLVLLALAYGGLVVSGSALGFIALLGAIWFFLAGISAAFNIPTIFGHHFHI